MSTLDATRRRVSLSPRRRSEIVAFSCNLQAWLRLIFGMSAGILEKRKSNLQKRDEFHASMRLAGANCNGAGGHMEAC